METTGPLSIRFLTSYIEKSWFPRFFGVATHTVNIGEFTKNSADFAAANAAAGLKRTPTDFTWHHNEDGKTMQLVPSDIHAKTGHTGGASLSKIMGAVVLAAIMGDTGAAIVVGDKQATDNNVALAAQDFLTNLLPFAMGIGNAGEGSDRVWQNSDGKNSGPQGCMASGGDCWH